jgi:HEPN domain-containing protein
MPAMNRAQLQRLANERIQDARALLAARRWSAAYYLAGYAVECGLKACIAKLMKAEEFPDKSFAEKCWTHDLDRLVILAGLRDQRDTDSKADIQFRENWATVNDWDESSRYARTIKKDAQELVDAIIDTRHGVLPWIKLHW